MSVCERRLGADMSFCFDAEKTVQALGCIFHELEADSINLMKALKLLYLIDREALAQGDTPITGDSAIAMKLGPVLSTTYDLMKTPSNWPEPTEDETLWLRHFRTDSYDLTLLEPTRDDRLSAFDRKVIQTVAQTYGHLDHWALSDRTHEFPEWRKNERGNAAVPIPLRDILEALGKTDQVEAIEREADEARHFQKLFGS